MTASLFLQYAAIALAVLASAAVVAKKQFPGAVRRLRTALAWPRLHDGRAPWLQALGRRIAPPGSGSGASACGGCCAIVSASSVAPGSMIPAPSPK